MNRIKELRTERRWTQTELGAMMQRQGQAISKYELGQLDLDTDTIRRLCEIFDVTADYLLGLSEIRRPEISLEEQLLLLAYRSADLRTRQLVNLALMPYGAGEKENTAAG